MPRLPKGPVRGLCLMTLFVLNTLAVGLPLIGVALLKLMVPVPAFRRTMSAVLIRMAETWVSINGTLIRATQRIEWQVRGLEGLSHDGWYLVIANHRSWIDIIALQTTLNRKIPLLKFFIKDELKWVPVLGLAWWALDMPFMKRYSKETLARHPELRGKDLKATQRACERFRDHPTSVINFVEGTRFTPAKRDATRSPYRYLMKPRAGGIAFVIDALGPVLHDLLDVTVAYPDGEGGLWDLCCGRIPTIVVEVTRRSMPVRQAAGDYVADGDFRGRFQEWLGVLWREKDARLAEILSPDEPTRD
jgi:1-acyl-sn-glycerol-3-phosphate acyltransferase